MRVRALTILLGTALGIFATAQSPLGQERPGITGPGVNAVFAKVDPVFAQNAKLKPYGAVTFGEGPALRTEMVKTMHAVFEHYRPGFRVTPRPFRIIEPYLDMNKDAAVKAQLRELIEWGAVPPAGPLVTGGETLTPEQFGDALGYFYAMLTKLTYQPDPRWTAELSPLD